MFWAMNSVMSRRLRLSGLRRLGGQFLGQLLLGASCAGLDASGSGRCAAAGRRCA
ncbi:MAG: hypothetical protein MZV65_44405 [Chromatiales bacterium]|nr:hypothetical protein [Chromatiales bacterium]